MGKELWEMVLFQLEVAAAVEEVAAAAVVILQGKIAYFLGREFLSDGIFKRLSQ